MPPFRHVFVPKFRSDIAKRVKLNQTQFYPPGSRSTSIESTPLKEKHFRPRYAPTADSLFCTPRGAVKNAFEALPNLDKSESLDEAAGMQCSLRALLDVDSSGGTPHRARAVMGWSTDDISVSEVWPRAAEECLLFSDRMASSQGDSEVKTRGGDECIIIHIADSQVRIAKRFNTATESIRIPLLAESFSHADIITALREKLLPFRVRSSAERTPMAPFAITFASTVPATGSVETSVIVTFAHPFEHKITQKILQRVATLFSVPIANNRIALCGNPRIIRLGRRQENSCVEILGKSDEKEKNEQDIFVDIDLLPDFEANITLRDTQGRLGILTESLDLLQREGFVNYTDTFRNGKHIFHAFMQGKHLVAREFDQLLLSIARGLAALGSGALRDEFEQETSALRMLSSSRSSAECVEAWRRAENRIRPILIADETLITERSDVGVSTSPGLLLRQLLQSVVHHRGDEARALRDTLERSVLRGIVQALVDVQWNAFASLRLKVLGPRVVKGDIVCTEREMRWDVHNSDFASDFFPTIGSGLPEFSDMSSAAELEHNFARAPNCLHIVETDEEARSYSLRDVVLPKMGRAVSSSSKSLKLDALSQIYPFFPQHTCGASAFATLAQRLGVENIPHVRLAPLVTYRRLVDRPSRLFYHIFDDELERYEASDAAPPLDQVTKKDVENIRRFITPYDRGLRADALPRIARKGIREGPARASFLEIAQGTTSALVSMCLPRGCHISSAIRDGFIVKRILSTDVLELLESSLPESKTVGMRARKIGLSREDRQFIRRVESLRGQHKRR